MQANDVIFTTLLQVLMPEAVQPDSRPNASEENPSEENSSRESSSKNSTQEGQASTSRISGIEPIFEKVTGAMPDSYTGRRRLRYLAETVNKFGNETESLLKSQVNAFVQRMVSLEASDMDMGGNAAKNCIWFRVEGKKSPERSMGTYSPIEADILILNLLSSRRREKVLEEGSVDFSYRTPSICGEDGRPRRFRVTVYLELNHLALNMRAIEEDLFNLEDLGFHPKIQKGMMFRHVRDGLTLITGVTGSGKSSTLDAIIDKNNEDFRGHILVIGKPVEYTHASKKSIIRHREVGTDVTSFKDGIIQALRQDPDIVVIGEMRHPEAIKAALEITDSGHKVFSTLHTSSAIETISRIVAEMPPEEQNRIRNRLGDVLRCVVSQKLLPKRGGGLQMAKEVLWVNSSVRAAIKNDNIGEIYQMMWEGQTEGEHTLEQDLYRLTKKGKIEPSDALDYANNRKRIRRLFQ